MGRAAKKSKSKTSELHRVNQGPASPTHRRKLEGDSFRLHSKLHYVDAETSGGSNKDEMETDALLNIHFYRLFHFVRKETEKKKN